MNPFLTSSTRARQLTALLGGLMFVQAVLGLAFQARYRDAEWIRATWYGNDWVTLVVAAPLLLIGRAKADAGSARGVLLSLGVTAYAAYNYAFYLFGAALNVFFPLYVALIVVAAATLIITMPVVDVGEVARRFRSRGAARLLGAYFMFVGVGLMAVWLGMWAAYVFFGRPTPVEPEAFRLVAALDLSIMVPLLVAGGILMWRTHTWGPLVCALAGVQASLYLLVLSVNAIIVIQRGLVASPGEVPVWGTLMVVTTAATAVLMRKVDGSLNRPRDKEAG